jgi:hypothetical protein
MLSTVDVDIKPGYIYITIDFEPNIYLVFFNFLIALKRISKMTDAYRNTDFSLSLPDRIHAYLASVANDPIYNGFSSPLPQQIHAAKYQYRAT